MDFLSHLTSSPLWGDSYSTSRGFKCYFFVELSPFFGQFTDNSTDDPFHDVIFFFFSREEFCLWFMSNDTTTLPTTGRLSSASLF